MSLKWAWNELGMSLKWLVCLEILALAQYIKTIRKIMECIVLRQLEMSLKWAWNEVEMGLKWAWNGLSAYRFSPLLNTLKTIRKRIECIVLRQLEMSLEWAWNELEIACLLRDPGPCSIHTNNKKKTWMYCFKTAWNEFEMSLKWSWNGLSA